MIEEQGEKQIKALGNRVEKIFLRRTSKINCFFVLKKFSK